MGWLIGLLFLYTLQPVLPDGLDQLPPRKLLFTVILATINKAEVRIRAKMLAI